MKIATRTLLPAAVLVLAACGSGTTSATKSSSGNGAGAPASDQVELGAPTRKGAAKARREAIDKLGRDAEKALAKAGVKAKRAPKTQAPSPAFRHRSGFGVGSAGVFAAGSTVVARAPFQVALMSLDGKAHTCSSERQPHGR